MNILEAYQQHFLPTYHNYPQGKYITLLVARWIESEAIFRTEGSGEPLSKEFVLLREGGEAAQRVVISKRKQTAVERRTGRELLRRHALLGSAKEGVCALNSNNPCERCIDCMIYGYAAGGGGAQKSRVITDDAFSLHPAHQVIAVKTFNAPFEDGAPWDAAAQKRMTGLGSDEYVKPGAVFLDMETLKDVTPGEFRYILGNLLRSSRYGAISSRIGKVDNVLLGVLFSDCELFSNLELTQRTYQLLQEAGADAELAFPLAKAALADAARRAADELRARVLGQVTALTGDELAGLEQALIDLYSDPDALAADLRQTAAIYPNGVSAA